MQYESTTLRPTTQDLTGQTFDRLTVIQFAGYTANRQSYWVCLCSCGTTKDIQGANLFHKNTPTRSCGCWRREMCGNLARSHGRSYTSEYQIWNSMLARCENPNAFGYPRYGARGITVCEAWHDFRAFYADMGPRPSPNHSIERKDNDGHYTPDNCVWLLSKYQVRNMSTTMFLTYNNLTKSVSEWAEITGIHVKTLYARKHRYGWSDEETVTIPLQPRKGPKLSHS